MMNKQEHEQVINAVEKLTSVVGEWASFLSEYDRDLLDFMCWHIGCSFSKVYQEGQETDLKLN